MANLADRLNEALGRVEAERDELIEKLGELERITDYIHWYRHTEIEAAEDTLPAPRLEIVLHDGDCLNEYRWKYSLVIKHLLGYHVRVPLGVTTTSGTFVHSGGKPNFDDTPFRDGAHFRHDAESLKLPAFVVIDGSAREFVAPTEAK